MRIALYAPRCNHLKILAPLAAELLRRGHAVRYWYPSRECAGDKDDAWRDAFQLQREGGAAAHFVDGRPAEIDALVTVGLRLPAFLRETQYRQRFALGYHEEELIHAHEGWWTDGTEVLTWTEAHARRLESICPGRKAHVVGFPELDQLAGMDRAVCRAKHGLPAAGKILLLMPAARAHLLRPRWAAWWYRRMPMGLSWAPWSGADRVPSSRAILGTIRAFADRHDCLVVAKTRDKHPRLPSGLADRVIGDESFHPFTTLELMVAADYAVGLAGGWAVEAEAAGLPHLDILAYPQEAYEHPALLDFRRELYGDDSGLWRGPRVYTRTGWDWLAGWARSGAMGVREPVRHDGKASSRAADVIEEMTP